MIEVIVALSALALSHLPGAAAVASQEDQVALAPSHGQPKSNCATDDKGQPICGLASKPGTLPTGAKVAIALVSLTVVFLLLLTIFFIRRSRAAAAEAARDVAVEESQMTGPAPLAGALYTPATGVYSIGPDTGGFSAVPVTPQHRAFAAPTTAVVPPTPSDDGRSPQPYAFPMPSPGVPRSAVPARVPAPAPADAARSAPAHKPSFSDGGYPFTGFGSTAGAQQHARSPSAGSHSRSAFVSSGGFPRPLLAGRLKDRIRERPTPMSPTLNSPSLR